MRAGRGVVRCMCPRATGGVVIGGHHLLPWGRLWQGLSTVRGSVGVRTMLQVRSVVQEGSRARVLLATPVTGGGGAGGRDADGGWAATPAALARAGFAWEGRVLDLLGVAEGHQRPQGPARGKRKGEHGSACVRQRCVV